MKSHIDFGKFGEDQARLFLIKQGYSIIESNYRNVMGEIDIIAKERETLCFIEVKTRKNDALGSPFESVTKWKQKKILKVALCYIQEKDLDNINVRFDVVGIINEQGKDPKIELIKDAFEVVF